MCICIAHTGNPEDIALEELEADSGGTKEAWGDSSNAGTKPTSAWKNSWTKVPQPTLSSTAFLNGASNSVQFYFGQQANNLCQLVILFVLLSFLAVLFPEDLETPNARKTIGRMLIVSDVCDTYVTIAHAQGGVVQSSLLLLGNLSSNAVDEQGQNGRLGGATAGHHGRL